MFNPFSWFRKNNKKEEDKEVPKKIERNNSHIPAKNWTSTVDADNFVNQLTTFNESDFFAAKIYNISKTKKNPQCIEMRLVMEEDDAGSVSTYTEIIGFSYKDKKWIQETHAFRNSSPITHGNVDEFIAVAAADGWNCTIPATDVMMAFIGSIVKTQGRNKSKPTKSKTTVVVKFYMPWRAVPPKIRISAFDPTSLVGENLAPSMLIPFNAARKPAARGSIEKTV